MAKYTPTNIGNNAIGTGANTDLVGFPSNFVPTADKLTPEYHYKYANAMWGEYNRNLNVYSERKLRWINNRKYAEGLQSIDKYKNRFNIEGDTSYLNMDFTAVSILPKYVDITMGRLNQKYRATVTANDDLQKSKIGQKRDELKANMLLKPLHDEMKAKAGISILPPNAKVPADDEELELMMDEFIPDECLAMQLALKAIFNKNQFPEVENQVKRDLIVIKNAFVRVFMDQNGDIIPSYIDPVNLVVPYSKRDDYANIPHWGYVEKLTIQTLSQKKNEDGTPCFDEKDLQVIAKNYTGLNGNPSWNTTWNAWNSYEGYYSNNMAIRPYDDFFISVLNYEFLSVNTDAYSEKVIATPTGQPAGQTETGEKMFFNKKSSTYQHPKVQAIIDSIKGKEKRISKNTELLTNSTKQNFITKKLAENDQLKEKIKELTAQAETLRATIDGQELDDVTVHTRNVEYRYSGKWIINSPYLYQIQKDNNLPRKKDGKTYSAQTRLSLFGISPDMYDMENKSLVERAITHADQITLLRLNVQKLIMASIPPGVAIDLTAIDNTIKGKGNIAMQPLEQLQMFRQVGSIMFRSVCANGQLINGKPIEMLPNGIPPGLDQLFYDITQEVQLMKEVFGLNDATDASTPTPEAPVGGMEVQIQGTNNAIFPLMNGFLRLMNNVANTTTLLIQDKIEYGDKDEMKRLIGDTVVDTIEMSKTIPFCDFGAVVEFLPAEAEIQMELGNIATALETQEISVADSIKAKRLLKEDPLLCERFLLYKIKKNREQKLQDSQALQSQNGQVQVQSAMAAEQAKQKTLQLEYQLKAQFEQLQNQGAMQLQALKNQGLVNATQVNNVGKVEVAQTANEGKIAHAVVEHTSALHQMAYEHAVAPKETASATA